MFELGARPHPPRDLYRAYLEQSDVFVGIYGEATAGSRRARTISGLEDEYELAPRAMPKLIYVKESDRDERLVALIERIRADDTASYMSFSTRSSELAELVEADLATLLAERFDGARAPAAHASEVIAPQVPAPYTRLIGRESELAAVSTLLARRRDAAGHPARPWGDRQESTGDRGRVSQIAGFPDGRRLHRCSRT